jgi:hypothetical protein
VERTELSLHPGGLRGHGREDAGHPCRESPADRADHTDLHVPVDQGRLGVADGPADGPGSAAWDPGARAPRGPSALGLAACLVRISHTTSITANTSTAVEAMRRIRKRRSAIKHAFLVRAMNRTREKALPGMFLSREGQNSGTIDYRQTSAGTRTWSTGEIEPFEVEAIDRLLNTTLRGVTGCASWSRWRRPSSRPDSTGHGRPRGTHPPAQSGCLV